MVTFCLQAHSLLEINRGYCLAFWYQDFTIQWQLKDLLEIDVFDHSLQRVSRFVNRNVSEL